MQQQLVTLVLSFWAAISPAYLKMPHAQEIAAAIASELEGEALGSASPVYLDANEDVGMAAYFAVRESSLDPAAAGDCASKGDPSSCLSKGVWQLRGPCGIATVAEQVHCWMTLLRYSPCPDHPIATMWGKCSGRSPLGDVEVLAAKREKRVRELLAALALPVVATGLPPMRRARVKRATPALVAAANGYLLEAIDLPLGTEQLVEVDGKRYALVIERHWHPDGFTAGPTGWHKGVTVFEVR